MEFKIEHRTSNEKRPEALKNTTRSDGKANIGYDTLTAMIVVAKANAQSLPDNLAVMAAALYDDFEDVIGLTVDKGYKFRYAGKVWKTVQDCTKIQEQYPPGAGTESLYTEINEESKGTIKDPIPYNNNMELLSGKYYQQDGITYLCIRDTGQPVYHDLKDLVGIYVQIA